MEEHKEIISIRERLPHDTSLLSFEREIAHWLDGILLFSDFKCCVSFIGSHVGYQVEIEKLEFKKLIRLDSAELQKCLSIHALEDEFEAEKQILLSEFHVVIKNHTYWISIPFRFSIIGFNSKLVC